MRAIVEHGGDRAVHMSQSVVFHYHQSHAGRGEIFLRSGIYEIIFAHIDRPAEYIGTHVGHHRHRRIRILADFGTVDGIV